MNGLDNAPQPRPEPGHWPVDSFGPHEIDEVGTSRSGFYVRDPESSSSYAIGLEGYTLNPLEAMGGAEETIDPGVLDIRFVNVDSSRQRQGTGTKLARRVLAEGANRGLSLARGNVENPRMVGVFSKLGAEPIVHNVRYVLTPTQDALLSTEELLLHEPADPDSVRAYLESLPLLSPAHDDGMVQQGPMRVEVIIDLAQPQ